MTSSILPGAEPWSHTAPDPGCRSGVLVLHGFTGNPSSVRGVALALAEAGHHVELPRLPGHGTTVEEMQRTDWHDWTDEVATARARLAERADRIVLAGLSMGGTLALHAALGWAERLEGDLRGVLCINPVTRAQPAEVIEMLQELRTDGMHLVPGGGADIADPNAIDLSYEGTPVIPLLSLQLEGLAPMQDRYGEITAPLQLVTSRQDHVVDPADSEHLADTYGGEVEHLWLERSYHVATQDYDRELIISTAIDFVGRVTGEAGQAGRP